MQFYVHIHKLILIGECILIHVYPKGTTLARSLAMCCDVELIVGIRASVKLDMLLEFRFLGIFRRPRSQVRSVARLRKALQPRWTASSATCSLGELLLHLSPLSVAAIGRARVDFPVAATAFNFISPGFVLACPSCAEWRLLVPGA